jgi:uncharacterized protein
MKIAVFDSDIRGKGVFATAPISVGETIHHMGGTRLGLAACVWRIATRQVNFDDPLPITAKTFLILDEFSNRFNHSCAPNAALRKSGEMFALTAITPDQEITFDYSTTMRRSYYSRLWTMPCNCGAPTCRHSIGDIGTVPIAQRATYFAAGALMDFMLVGIGAHPEKTLPTSVAPRNPVTPTPPTPSR